MPTDWHEEYDNLCKVANDYERRAEAAEDRVEALEEVLRYLVAKCDDVCREVDWARAVLESEP